MNLKALPVALALVIALAFAAGCGGSDDTSSDPTVTQGVPTVPDVSVDPADIAPYPDDVKAEFLKNCDATSGGEKSMCACILDAFETTLPIDLYNKINDPNAQEIAPAMPKATQDAANQCVEDASKSKG